MSAKHKEHHKPDTPKLGREELTSKLEKLSEIEIKLHKTTEESRSGYTKRIEKVAEEINDVLSEEKEGQVVTSAPQLMKAVVRKAKQRVKKDLAKLEKLEHENIS